MGARQVRTIHAAVEHFKLAVRDHHSGFGNFRAHSFVYSAEHHRGGSVQLTIEQVSKCYRGKVWALRNFSLTLGPGVLGLLGPNGAGKTTLMSILATITRASEGKITWNGTDLARNPNAIRAVLGYLPQDFGVYPNLNAVEFLAYLAAVKGLDAGTARRRIDELLDIVNLSDVRKRPLGNYSGGMKQRIGIAQALLNDPQLLIVDEPTVGLDPEERVRFRNLLSDLSGERVVILSTHIVSDVEATATHIALINRGNLVLHATPEELLRKIECKVWEWVVPSAEVTAMKQRYLTSGMVRRSDGVHVRVLADTPPPGALRLAPTLEDAYLYALNNHRSGDPA
jgi:ABC-type multidrug transport system ATPase subunit